jgi:hypothetical protein
LFDIAASQDLLAASGRELSRSKPAVLAYDQVMLTRAIATAWPSICAKWGSSYKWLGTISG